MGIEVTVGIDIGTTSVKAVAADGDGAILARSRVAHRLYARRAGELAHDARAAWHDGVLAALASMCGADVSIRGVNVAAMVPSLSAVDEAGLPLSDGLLYGDDRGAGEGNDSASTPAESGELARFLACLARAYPTAAGFWPAQAVANRALGGGGAIDTVVAMTAVPLFDYTGWDAQEAARAGVADTTRLPLIVAGTEPIGTIEHAGGAPLGPGTIDAFAEQLVAGADEVGDVLVILGATLIVWAVIGEWREVDGLWTVPHTVPGKVLIGGPSNAGGLFVDWVGRLLGDVASAAPTSLDRVPVWQPYLRGERVPLHDPARRASLHDLDIGLDAGAVRRASYEASAFAARHMLDLAGLQPNRIVASGGGTRDAAWVQALADGTGLPVDVVRVPEGGALGAAFLARVTAGLEPDSSEAGRWAATDRRVEPAANRLAVEERYSRYRELAR